MAFTLVGVWCATAAAADGGGTHGCVWSPIQDVPAVQKVVAQWAASTKLPPFDEHAWGMSIEHGSAGRLTLPFAIGTLTLGWDLDQACAPTAITVEASSDYAGPRPNDAAVRRLVEGLRALTVEQRIGPNRGAYSAMAFGVALGALLIALLLRAGRRWRAAGMPFIRVRGVDLVRLLGLLGIVALLPYQPAPPFLATWLYANALVLIGVLPLIAFLWLAVSGWFGYGSPRRDDWPALVVFLLALGIREGYARHAIEEIEIHFFYGAFPNRHSVVYPLFQMFLQPLGRDPYLFMMHVNGILGALATLPLYLFVRQRTDSAMAAALVAVFFAVHPIIVQMAPTDGHYSLVLFTWFSGLALLTADDVGARQLLGGAALLGIAATSRAEGTLYLLASMLLIDVHALLAAVRRHVGAAVLSGCVVLGLVAVHVYFCFPGHIAHGQHLPNIGTVGVADVLQAGLLSLDYNDPIFVALVLIGAVAGLVAGRLRIGLGAALATLVVVWPMSMTTTGGFTILHRLVPVCALQTIAAGVGAAWVTSVVSRKFGTYFGEPLAFLARRPDAGLSRIFRGGATLPGTPRASETGGELPGHHTSWLPSRMRQHWAAALPALAVALYLFAVHRHEVRDPNAVTDEFWMLRNHLAPGGIVNTDCTLLSFGRSMDTDIHNFSQVLPGITSPRCEQEDCVRIAAAGGCIYYLRSLSCFFSEDRTAPECLARGRTPAGDLFACIDPRCAELERALVLVPVEERTVDLYAVFHGLPDRPQWPRAVDIGLYQVIAAKR